jgi:glutaminyl-peptide cyclotransferase
MRFGWTERLACGWSRKPAFALGVFATLAGLAGLLPGCATGSSRAEKPAPAASSAAPQSSPPTAIAPADAAPPAAQTGGFDGVQAFEYLAKQVAFGPRPAGSPALARTQDYIKGQLSSCGCSVDEDNFTAQTPIGPIPMKNILAKVSGTGREIILLLTHYDTVRVDNFVGANDSASSTAVMMEMARLYCGAEPAKKLPTASLWIAFLDGEEAQKVVNGVAQWTDEDSVYGSRELAARMALSGDLKRTKAVVLADMIGDRDLHIQRERESTPWLTDLIWATAKRLGYGTYFLDDMQGPVGDDHGPFIRRGVSAVDLIDFESQGTFWHTPQDTLDKVAPHSLAVVGHVLVEALPQIDRRGR